MCLKELKLGEFDRVINVGPRSQFHRRSAWCGNIGASWTFKRCNAGCCFCFFSDVPGDLSFQFFEFECLLAKRELQILRKVSRGMIYMCEAYEFSSRVPSWLHLAKGQVRPLFHSIGINRCRKRVNAMLADF